MGGTLINPSAQSVEGNLPDRLLKLDAGVARQLAKMKDHVKIIKSEKSLTRNDLLWQALVHVLCQIRYEIENVRNHTVDAGKGVSSSILPVHVLGELYWVAVFRHGLLEAP